MRVGRRKYRSLADPTTVVTTAAERQSIERIKNDVRTTLHEIQGSSAFSCGSLVGDPPKPRLFLKAHGSIGVPLSRHDANIIISKSKQSPFGRGADTVVDTSVRKSWQLDPSEFSVRNPQWKVMIDKIIGNVYDGLSLQCGPANISAELYKLLLYEEGAFFKAHKDSEKTPGMFGTLIVCLPSLHEGGDLILTHNDEKITIKTAPTSEFGTSFAAWYSDVLHEVTPVTSGCRLVLTYNLIRRNGISVRMPPSLSSYKGRLVAAFHEYNTSLQKSSSDYPSYLIHKLEHQYSQASLRAVNLKGVDLGHVQCLKEAATEAGFTLYLANLEKTIIRSDEDWEDIEVGRKVKLTFVANLQGSRVDNPSYEASDLNIDKDQYLDPNNTDDEDVDDEKHSGPTGNEGMSATYWYRNMVIVIVPPSKNIEFLYSCDSRDTKVLPWVRELQSVVDSDPSQKPKLADLCEVILSVPTPRYSWHSLPRPSSKQEGARISLKQELVLAALQCDRIDLYEKAVGKVTEPLLPEAFDRLGRLLAVATNFPLTMSRIEAAFKLTPNLNERYVSLKRFEEGFLDALTADNGGKSSKIKDWVKEVLVGAVNEARASQKIRKVDGASLAEITKTWNLEDVQEQVLPALAKCDAACKAAFVNRLISCAEFTENENQDAFSEQILSEDDRLGLSGLVLANLWEDFHLDSKAVTIQPKSTLQNRFTPPTTTNDGEHIKKYEDALPSGVELAELIQNTLLLEILDEERVKYRLERAVTAADDMTLLYTWISFTHVILEQKVGCYQLSPEGQPTPAAIIIVTQILEKLAISVGEEPTGPTHWAQEARGCGCRDCSAVDRFLMDQTQSIGQFPMSNARRHHLHTRYTDSSGPSYTVKTLRGCSPNIWQITKNKSRDKIAHEEWKRKFDNARRHLRALQKAGPLDKYLGSMADAIMSLDIDQIALERSKLLRELMLSQPPFMSSNTNIQARGEVRGIKRAASSVTGSSAKRSRNEPMVIDLT